MSALIAFEGLDQSGKETQSRLLRARLEAKGHRVETLTFPDDGTPLGKDIRAALAGARDHAPDVMQLLYIANRYEWKPEIERELRRGTILICDRYLASSIVYGESFGLDAAWLRDTQKYLPQPDLTFLLDIAPDVSARRKTSDRDKYERDLDLLGRVRESYLRQVTDGWLRLDANRDRQEVAADVFKAVGTLL
jgi:dTMP kinase